MSKHTPGPWTVQRRDHGAGIGSSYRINGPNGEIAENYDDSPANATLIAAAPIMLAALRVAYTRLEVLENVVANQSPRLWQDMRTVEAAIKAAEGKQS